MAEYKLPFDEGASINRPLIFCGLNYQFWKVRMRIFCWIHWSRCMGCYC